MKMSLTPLEFHELMQGAPQPPAPKMPLIHSRDVYIAINESQGIAEDSLVAFDMQTQDVKQKYKNIALQLNKRLQSA